METFSRESIVNSLSAALDIGIYTYRRKFAPKEHVLSSLGRALSLWGLVYWKTHRKSKKLSPFWGKKENRKCTRWPSTQSSQSKSTCILPVHLTTDLKISQIPFFFSSWRCPYWVTSWTVWYQLFSLVEKKSSARALICPSHKVVQWEFQFVSKLSAKVVHKGM